MTRPTTRAAGTAATLLVLALVAGGCQDDAEPSADPTPSASTSVAPPAKTAVTYGRVTGKLPTADRKRLAAKVGAVVDGWMDAAYVGGDYPRRGFSDAWPGFTPGARDEARHDRALMSNADIGRRVDTVDATRRRVRIDALAVRKRPVGVTAHVLLDFATTGKVKRKVRVQGRLYLTHRDGGWRVFGYDVTKGGAR